MMHQIFFRLFFALKYCNVVPHRPHISQQVEEFISRLDAVRNVLPNRVMESDAPFGRQQVRQSATCWLHHAPSRCVVQVPSPRLARSRPPCRLDECVDLLPCASRTQALLRCLCTRQSLQMSNCTFCFTDLSLRHHRKPFTDQCHQIRIRPSSSKRCSAFSMKRRQ